MTLGYDVFVADPVPLAGSLPTGEPRRFQLVAVTMAIRCRNLVAAWL